MIMQHINFHTIFMYIAITSIFWRPRHILFVNNGCSSFGWLVTSIVLDILSYILSVVSSVFSSLEGHAYGGSAAVLSQSHATYNSMQLEESLMV